MPELSRFYGISIRMYFDDHNPPHFHAIYAGDEVEIGIDPLTIARGRFPQGQLGQVLKWATMHRADLLESWERMRTDQPPLKIEPLK